MDSLHSDFHGAVSSTDKDSVPGGLDPFDVGNEDEPRNEMEPGGISLFATLIERLLSRFEFDAQDIRITIRHPDNVSVTLTLSKIKYSSNIQQPEAPSPSGGGRTPSVTRSLTVNGITVHMRDLRTNIVYQPEFATMVSHSPTLSTKPSSPHRIYQSGSANSSSSSLDEETTMAMSQSLASLPPRAPSPSQSMSSSMYQSALSVVNEEDESTSSKTTHPPPPVANHPDDVPPPPVSMEEVVFSSGSFPITVKVMTVPPSSNSRGPSDERDKVTFSLQTGLLSSALRSWHIAGLLHLTNAVVSRMPKPGPRSSTHTTTATSAGLALFDVEGSLDLRGIVLHLLPLHSNTTVDDYQQFFLHPLVPPSLPFGYLRMHVEGIAASLALPSQLKVTPKPSIQARSRPDNHLLMKGAFSIHNVSVFAFRSRDDNAVSAFPVLFTDPHLVSQYSLPHTHPSEVDRTLNKPLPDFDVLDWTARDQQKRGGARLSHWRCKPKSRQHTRRYPQDQPNIASPPTHAEDLPGRTSDEHAFSITLEKVRKRKRSAELAVEGKVAPLHILVDLDTIIGDDTVMNFVQEVSRGLKPSEGSTPEDADRLDQSEMDDTPPASPRARERRRLERMVLDDLDLEYDYEGAHTRAQHGSLPRKVGLSICSTKHSITKRIPD